MLPTSSSGEAEASGAMSHYRSNLRDIEFTLFEVFGVGQRLGQGPFAEVDEETARGILGEVERLASGPLAESLLDSDRHPPVFDPQTNTATVPESFRRSFQAYMDAEWWRMQLPEEIGGTVVPSSLKWAAEEMILGANPAVHMYASGMPFAHLLYRLGTEDQKKWAHWSVEKRWGATMVLTEPDAGSDVGAGRARAVEQPDGTWCWPGRRAPAPAPRGCPCSWCRSSTSTSRPASWASATASTRPTSRRRWASRPPPPGRAPDAHAAEGVRGGHARADALRRDPAGRGHGGAARGPHRRGGRTA